MSKDYDVILGFMALNLVRKYSMNCVPNVYFFLILNQQNLDFVQDDNPPQNTCHPCSFADTGEHNTVLANELQAEVY